MRKFDDANVGASVTQENASGPANDRSFEV